MWYICLSIVCDIFSLSENLTCKFLSSRDWWGSGHTTLIWHLAYWVSSAEGIWWGKEGKSRRFSDLLPLLPWNRSCSSGIKGPSLSQEEDILSQDGELGAPKNLYPQTLLNNPNLPIYFTIHYTNPKPPPKYFTNFLFLCLKGIKTSCSGHFLESLFSCEDSCVHVKIP